MKYKKSLGVCLVVIIAILGLNIFKINISNIKGVLALEKTHEKIYDKDYGYEISMDGKSEHKYITRMEDGEKVLIDFMKNKGFHLNNNQGTLLIFSSGATEISLNRTTLLNKYYVWEN